MIITGLFFLLEFLPLVGYISGNTVFPKPLSREEEKKYVALFMEGDEDAKTKLIEHNMRLIAHISKKYMGTGRDMDDLISIGSIGLIKAVNTYKPESGKPLGTYAARCIENEILMSVRQERKKRGEVPMEDAIGADRNGNQVLLSEVLGTPGDEVERQAELRLSVTKLYHVIEERLTKRERTIIQLRYGLYGGYLMTQREIAERMDISRSYVSRIEKKALGKLADAMAEEMGKEKL
ncbi:RNA polymerase sporulation sigma factor SigK [Eubacteriales bacterium OttesenSCG-928-M02]|nr:RNA polymerase sporulation sigma factor SigK [Eubacteriales bacterium OttesenSCG-928-M02]